MQQHIYYRLERARGRWWRRAI